MSPRKKSTESSTKSKAKTPICFVLMPFKESFRKHYETIFCPAIEEIALRPKRGDSLFRPSAIMDDIWRMIQDAEVILAELTGRNANVFYELGLAHALGKPVVLVSETIEDVPFDLQALRVITYDKNDPEWGILLRESVVGALRETLATPVEAVPPMYRKEVPSKAPEDSAVRLRLSRLERRMRSLERKPFLSGPTGVKLRLGDDWWREEKGGG